MMTKLRELSKIFIVIVALSFIALMVFEWGMDYSGRSGQSDVVGEVNGKELGYSQFMEMYQQMYQEQKARTGKTEFTDEELQMLRDQVWERFVQQTLFNEEMEKLGISVSDSEIVYQIYNYPLEDFKQHPSFQTDGIFDMQKYRAALGNPQIPWMQVEDIYRQQIPFLKLQNIITNTVRVTSEELKDSFKRQNLKAKVEYLAVLATSFNKPDITVSDQEMTAFYTEHKEDYKQNEQRTLSYVIFPLLTTAADTAHLMSEFESIRERLANGEDFNDLAREYSEDPSVTRNGGDLGYFGRGDMVKPFSDAAFAAETGSVIGPVKTNYGYHLIKVEDKKKEDGEQKVKASHILMKVTPAPSRIEDVEAQARLFSEDAKETGFAVQAEANGYELKETTPFEERSGFIPGIGRNLSIMNFAFASKLNDVSSAYKIDPGYVVLTVTDIQPEGYKDLESVKRFVENRVRLEKAKDLALAYIEALKPKIENGTPFKEIADQDESGNIRYDVTAQFTMDGNVTGVGRVIEFNATAFGLEEGEISDLVETERGYYYLKLLEKTAFNSTAFASQEQTLRRRLLNEKRTEVFSEWYAQLKEDADITDNRKMFNL